MKQSVDLHSFHEKLDRNNLGPLWASIHDLNTIEPKARPIPYLWKRELIEKHLEEAEDLLQVGDGADRRAVFLINPGMKDLIPYGWGELPIRYTRLCKQSNRERLLRPIGIRRQPCASL